MTLTLTNRSLSILHACRDVNTFCGFDSFQPVVWTLGGRVLVGMHVYACFICSVQEEQVSGESGEKEF